MVLNWFNLVDHLAESTWTPSYKFKSRAEKERKENADFFQDPKV